MKHSKALLIASAAFAISIAVLIISNVGSAIWAGPYTTSAKIIFYVVLGCFLLPLLVTRLRQSNLLWLAAGSGAALIIHFAFAPNYMRLGFLYNKPTYERAVANLTETPRFAYFPYEVEGGPFVGAASVIRFFIFDETDEIKKPRADMPRALRKRLSEIDSENCTVRTTANYGSHFYGVAFIC